MIASQVGSLYSFVGRILVHLNLPQVVVSSPPPTNYASSRDSCLYGFSLANDEYLDIPCSPNWELVDATCELNLVAHVEVEIHSEDAATET